MINLLFEKLPDTLSISGSCYKIATDFRDWIAFFDMLSDNEITNKQKIILALQWFTDEIPSDIVGAYNALIDFASCEGIHFKAESENSKKSAEAPSLSWLYDSAYVLGAFRQVYGIDLIRVEYMHWWEFSALFEALPEDTMIKKRIAYRQIKISEIKDKNERKRIAKIKRSVAFPRPPMSAQQTANAFDF